MKRGTILIILVLLLITACQNNNTANTPEFTDTAESTDQPDPQVTPTEITMESLSPYRKGEDIAEKDPQFHLWMEPTEDNLVPPVHITCQGVESEVYGPPGGVSVDNHCIVYSFFSRATIVLPDLSILMLDEDTELQVNIDDEGTEIIVNQGGIYAVVADQEEGQRFIVTASRWGRFEALGTEFGLIRNSAEMLKDASMDFYMTAGKVATYVCESLDSPICENWIASDVFVTPFAKYSRPFNESDWQETLMQDEWYFQDAYENTFLGEASNLADTYARLNGASEDPWNVDTYLRLCNEVNRYIGNLSEGEENPYAEAFPYGEIAEEELWKLANDRNSDFGSPYCDENPSYCFAPTAKPTLIPAETDDSDPIWGSGGSSSGGSSSACSGVPSGILSQVQSCNCSNKSSYGVYCYYSNGMEGWIPEACAKAKNFCR